MATSKSDLIISLVKEVREEQKTINKTILGIDKKINHIEHNVEINTKDLTEHKLGVIQNRKRIAKLEEPKKAWKIISKFTISVGATAAAIYAILKLVGGLHG